MTKQTTIREVAARAGVSPSTVSRVLNGNDADHMRPETKERVLLAMKELDYTPVKAAQSLRRQRTEVIGILVPDISNPFFSLLARGAGSVAFEEGYSTLICDSNHSVEKESRYLETLLAEQVEGIVFIPVGQPNMEKVNRLLRRGVRIVVADRRVEGLPSVEANNHAGSRELTKYVLSLGHRKIAYIAGPEEVSTAQDRLAGFREAMKEADVEPVGVWYGNFTYEGGYQQAQEICHSYKVSAIMAANDLMAIGAIRSLENLGLNVPGEIGVTGFDYVLLAELFKPRLTSVRVPCFEIGSTAAMKLIKGESQENQQLPVRVVPGLSLHSSWPERKGEMSQVRFSSLGIGMRGGCTLLARSSFVDPGRRWCVSGKILPGGNFKSTMPWTRLGSGFTLERLKKVRYLWLKNPRKLTVTVQQQAKLQQLSRHKLKIRRPYRIKLALQDLFNQSNRQAGEAFLKQHRYDALNLLDGRLSTGSLEGINSLIRAAKGKSRGGYRTTTDLITMAYLIAGKIPLQLPT